MRTFVKDIINSIEPLNDSFFGPTYRCSLTLRDGTFLPCAVLQSKARVVELETRLIKEEMDGRGRIGGSDPIGQIISSLITSTNYVVEDNVISATKSEFATPISLMVQIHGETMMGWTGWVFRMKDGVSFSYGSGFGMSFLSLPNGYNFTDVAEVINHSFVDIDGSVASLQRGGFLPDNYPEHSILQPRIIFTCLVDGI